MLKKGSIKDDARQYSRPVHGATTNLSIGGCNYRL